MAVYLVGREGATKNEKPRMVEARTAASAIAHVARNSFSAVPLGIKEALAYSKQGVDLETAGEEVAPAEQDNTTSDE